jgi:hypothetical protein
MNREGKHYGGLNYFQCTCMPDLEDPNAECESVLGVGTYELLEADWPATVCGCRK